ncbi:TetR/AcrR family transcriptional regulator C-terminal domain-containing protein [Paenarthrobacter ilicis]|uniref:AcrR family transcriptional regulator n=1 Tax=Paenarthrobacter ilicis TaxID=43665 RepID=A0ABX0TNA5_9MICC|nr:TetR/AcrR family transcriptional regulator C-terminal domain-containing protein [Paenarthrobacter ilicis]MBM7793062.1 AcrR family transcriptional regulator [Paenarthrobacter ilicis]NIJ02162.1 AcrR family transcriptional regulator [Paenarthrobacter ilicis]
MTIQAQDSTSSKGRKRGGPLRINQGMILRVARTMDPATLTMQAVADELGVDRKALNYHVTDREGLLRLLAADVFESTFTEGFGAYFDAAGGTVDADWKTAIRAWAVTVRDSMVSTNVVSNYFRLNSDNLAVFEPAELVLQHMIRAGFDLPTAGRGLAFVTHFAMAVGRDIIMEQQLGEHPQGPEVRRLLENAEDTGGYEAFRGLIALEINGPQDIQAQFEFEIDIFIAGMERRLDAAR